MSRLIVKQIPDYYTEQKLKEHFASQGNVTDVKLMKTRQGKSKKYAFIGYKLDADALAAVKYFDNTFIDTSRILVQVAKTFSDPDVPLSFKQKQRDARDRMYEQEQRLEREGGFQRDNKRQKFSNPLDEEIARNSKLQEYMEVFKPSHQVKSWANDEVVDGRGAPSVKDLADEIERQDKRNRNGGSSRNDIGETATVDRNVNYEDRSTDDVEEDYGRNAAGGKITESDYNMAKIPENASDDEYDDFKVDKKEDDDEEMISLDTFKAETKSDESELLTDQTPDANMSDLDWLKSRRVRLKDNGDEIEKVEEPVEKVEETDEKPAPARTRPAPQPRIPEKSQDELHEEQIKETGRLFIRNILYESTEAEFRELFQLYGALEEVHVAIDTRTGKSKGFVYIQFKNSQDAFRAYKSLDKQIFQGRLLHILPGQKKKDHRMDEFDLKNLPLKKQRDLKRKDQATKSQFSWNSLYMNTDAVLESVAAKMGIAKSQLIDPENSNSAVKQALAEAHVIGDVRGYFEKRGVDLTQFDKKERDDKIILVKNFPHGTTIEEIGELFTEYGSLKRMLMPPSGTIAIVEFRDAPSARTAFNKLAYRRFKKSILYLEKGPKDLFTGEPSEDDVLETETKTDIKVVEAKVSANDVLGEANSDKDDENVHEGPTVSVFVKNLNFNTTQKDLTELFKSVPGFVIATVKTKPDPKNKDSTLSMGFGFAEFESKQQAEVAVSTLNGYVLEGHKLQLKLSHRQSTVNPNTKTDKSNKSNKIIIKNLPFEASRKDILELFGAFGNLKSVRVPKKFDKSARGFAFVEFTLLKEAENAMNQLHGVHLLGRRLVMQFAEHDAENAEEEIAKMTDKVKKQVAIQQLAANRLAGKGKIELEETEDDFAGL